MRQLDFSTAIAVVFCAGLIPVGSASARVLADAQAISRLETTMVAQGPADRLYNPATVEKVKGTIEAIDILQGVGVHVSLKTAAGPLEVRLGPRWYLDSQVPKLQVGDEIEVTGSRVQGKPAIIAAQVKKGDQTLSLRDDAGIPAWSRGRN